MFERFDRGMTAVRSSGRLFAGHPSLVVLPLLSPVPVGTAYPALGFALVRYGLVADLLASDVLRYGTLFVALSISSAWGSSSTRRSSAVPRSTSAARRPRFAPARRAWRVRAAVAKWGLLSATIETALAIAEDTVPGLGSLTRSVLDLTWGILTFFIVPVIVLDGPDGLRSGLRRSGGAFEETWTESATATVGIGVALLPIGLVGAVLLCGAYFVVGGPIASALGALGGVLLVGSVVVSQVLGAVVRTALYRYATTEDDVELVDELGPDGLFPDD